jgi:hypothetical protein
MTALTAPAAWLRRRDPGLVAVRRAARVTVAACAGFYACRYGLGNRVMAPYALFGAVAMGMLAQIPGTPAQRARTLLGVLPVGYLLVTAGTLLAVSNWAAAAGMFVLGFLVSYAGVGGPRLVGLANGVQLLYILPCFPPYDPGGSVTGWPGSPSACSCWRLPRSYSGRIRPRCRTGTAWPTPCRRWSAV